MSTIEIIEIESSIVASPVTCAVLLPPGYSTDNPPYPLCLNLHGGGMNHETLVNTQPLFDSLWDSGSLVPMVAVCANTTPLSFYLDDPEGDQWETFIAEELPAYMRANYHVRSDQEGTVMTGGSMGGHGTLKIAFNHPDRFIAIGALEPAVEPGLTRDESPPRSRLYAAHISGPAEKMLGPDADDDLFQRNSPASRLVRNADAIRDSGMKIYLECGDHDALNLQDGTEYLHRLLWDLDISHEYHLVKDADHVGPTTGPRLYEILVFLNDALANPGSPEDSPELSKSAQAWLDWTSGGMQGDAPDFNLMGDEGVAALRAQFSPARDALEPLDPTVRRRFARLPPTNR